MSLIDGPYITYKKDAIECIDVDKEGHISTESHKISEKDKITIHCNSATTHHKFQFKLKLDHALDSQEYEHVPSVFAISDIEGNFHSFSQLLIEHAVVTQDLRWNFKNGHLIIVGDIFDRKNDVLACLWLIYKLELEAEHANGKVHLLLGNHETMSLQGDLRYTHEKYLNLANILNIKYETLFSKHSELGKWLRSKHTAIVINKNLYVHAGISKEICRNNLSLNAINQIIRIYLGRKKQTFPLAKDHAKLLYSSFGPLWFRGYFLNRKDYNKIKKHELIDVLNFYNVKRIIVGHTTHKKIKAKFNNKLIAIDIFKPHKPDTKEALLIEDKAYYRVKENGKRVLLFKE